MTEQEIQKDVEKSIHKPVPQISEAEREFTNKLTLLRQEALDIRHEYDHKWDYYIAFARGQNHWSKRRPKYRVNGILNFIPSNIERKTALLTDTKPIIDVKPRRKSRLDDSADILKNVIDGIWAEQQVDQKLAELITLAQITGSCPVNTLWDKTLDFGSGDINIMPMDPRRVLVDNYITRSYRVDRGEYVIIDDIITLDKARDMFPNRADLIKPVTEFSSYKTQRERQSFWAKFYTPFKHSSRPSVIPRTLISEFWFKDRSKDKNGKYYFNGAVRRTVVCGGVIVRDGGNPYWDGKFPVDMLDWHFNVDSPYGWGDIELLSSPQMMINKLISTTLENAILMSNAIWVGDRDALSKEDWRKLNNEPGSYVRKRPGKELRREGPTQMSEYTIVLAKFLQEAMSEMSGMVPSILGQRSGQVSSGVGIEQLQMAAQAMIRLKARSIEALLSRIGQKLISRIFQFYTTDRVLNFLGKQDEFQLFEFIRTKLVGNKQLQQDAFKDYMFLVVPGSSLAMSKVQKAIVATQLFQMGILDEMDLLQAMEYPNAEKIAIQAKARREMMMKQMAQGQGAGGGQRSSINRQGAIAGRI